MLRIIAFALAAAFRSRQQIALENLALRHQIGTRIERRSGRGY